MKTKIREELKNIFKRTQEKRKCMKAQVYDAECAKIANQNFKDLENIIYSTIK